MATGRRFYLRFLLKRKSAVRQTLIRLQTSSISLTNSPSCWRQEVPVFIFSAKHLLWVKSYFLILFLENLSNSETREAFGHDHCLTPTSFSCVVKSADFPHTHVTRRQFLPATTRGSQTTRSQLWSQLTSHTLTWPEDRFFLLPPEGARGHLPAALQSVQEEKNALIWVWRHLFCFQLSVIYNGGPNNTHG